MQFSAIQISTWIGGKLEGDADTSVHQVAKIQEAKKGDLSFIANEKYVAHAYTTEASILIINEDLQFTTTLQPTLIRVKDAYTAFSKILEKVQQQLPQKEGIEQPSFVHETATLGENGYIGAFSYIGAQAIIGNNVKIYPNAYIGDRAKVGDNTIIYAGAKVYHQCKVGKDCIIHAGAVIGSDGFGFAPQADGTFYKIPQTGNVIIEDKVEIGANTTIDRATMGSTIIRKGVKLDNLIQVAHNVEIGENTVIAAQTGISGSTKIGKNCIIAGQVGFVGHVTIADRNTFGAQSGIPKGIKEEGGTWLGSPIMPHREAIKALILMRRLPELREQVRALEKKMTELEK